MTDNASPSVDNSIGASPQGMDTANTGTAGTTPIGALTPDKFSGKSREDVISMHSELERKLGQQGEEMGELRDFVSRVSPYFRVEGENVVLNDDLLRRYAEVQLGMVSKDNLSQQQPAKDNSPEQNGDFMEKFQNNPQPTLQEVIRSEIQKAFAERVEPLQQRFEATQHQSWIKGINDKYPDFQNYQKEVAKFITENQFHIDSPDKLEKAYLAVKAGSGGFIDKAQADKHIAELTKTLSMVSPGAVRPPLDESKMTGADLLGLNATNDETGRRNEILFGKKYLRE